MNKNYEAYLISENKSENTIKNYLRNVEDFFKFCNKADEDVTIEDMIAYKGSIVHYAPATVAIRLNSIKSYFNYLYMINAIPTNPTVNVTIPKVKNKVKPYITAEDIKALINSTSSIRNKVIISLTTSTGMRMEEMANITVKQYEDMKAYGKRNITIVGKGNKERSIYINDKTMEYIDEYLAKRAHKSEYLIESNYGNVLDDSNLNKTLKTIARKAGLPYWEDISMHWLRVAFATIANAKGCDIPTISAALGHSSIAITSRYIKTCQSDIDEAMRNMIF